MKRTFPKFGYNPVTGEWNDSLTGEFLWSKRQRQRSRAGCDDAQHLVVVVDISLRSESLRIPRDFPFCGNICGRPYLNLSLISSVYRAIGQDVRKELQGDMIGSAPAELDVPFIPFSPLTVLWKALPGMFKAQQNASRDAKRMPEFIATMPDWCRTTRATIQNCPDASSLLALWKESIKPAVVRACSLLRSVTMALSDPATKLRLDLIALIGEADANAILSNLSGSSGNLASLGPLLGLAQVANDKMSREDLS